MSEKRHTAVSHRRSPYEQGELKPSPERHVKRKKSKKSKKSHHYQLPPEAKPHVRSADEDDDVQIIEAVDHGEEEGGSLTIKPPQMQALKHKDKHKHKKDKHRSHEHSASRERVQVDKLAGHRERRKAAYPDLRDAREIVKERKKQRERKEKEIQKEIRDREARKREESIKERERLEKMELERRRDVMMREQRIKEKPRQDKRKEDRRPMPENRRELEKTRSEDRHSDEEGLRSRSREYDKTKDKTRHFPPPPRLQEDKGLKRELTKSQSSSSVTKSSRKIAEEKHSEGEQDTRMVVVDGSPGQLPP
ncbi:unnamed protein product, partial [Candidula unifasciata]